MAEKALTGTRGQADSILALRAHNHNPMVIQSHPKARAVIMPALRRQVAREREGYLPDAPPRPLRKPERRTRPPHDQRRRARPYRRISTQVPAGTGVPSDLARAGVTGIAFPERVTIMDLREGMCRWPVGDPTSPDFHFCGARSEIGSPYCEHHAQIAYQPADRRREKKAARG